jgi:hypothetical protein
MFPQSGPRLIAPARAGDSIKVQARRDNASSAIPTGSRRTSAMLSARSRPYRRMTSPEANTFADLLRDAASERRAL